MSKAAKPMGQPRGPITSEPQLLFNDTRLAFIGIVPTKVSTENGRIQIGDLLTTSRTPCYAMKASAILMRGVKGYRTGTILGKALEPLKHGKSVIKVLVTLR